MKPKLAICIVFVLSGSLAFVSALRGQIEASSKSEFQWGETVEGFQMATALDETNGIIHCWIRNATTNELDYSSFDVGYFENINLEIRGPTNWIKFRCALYPRSLGYTSVGPYLGKHIGPGQIVTNTFARSRSKPWPVLTPGEYLKNANGNTNEALATEKLNKWYAGRERLMSVLARSDTFTIDLFEMNDLQTFILTNSLEAKVSQAFSTRPETRVVIHSPAMELTSSLLQSCIKQNPSAVTIHSYSSQ